MGPAGEKGQGHPVCALGPQDCHSQVPHPGRLTLTEECSQRLEETENRVSRDALPLKAPGDGPSYLSQLLGAATVLGYLGL